MSKRNATLDILRSAAIILVINCHVVSHLHVGSALQLLQIGGKGVDLFFVLSGWLLGHQLLKELRDTGTIEVKRFWHRRWLRTLPAYYAVLVLTLAWQVLLRGNTQPQLGYFFFTQNYHATLPYFGVSWSLCVEEHFYLLVAPALLFFFRVRWSRILILPLLLLPIVCRQMGWYTAPHETHVRYDQCAVGVLLAWVEVFGPRLWQRLCQLAPYLAVLALAALTYPLLSRLAVCGLSGGYDNLIYALLFVVLVLLANSGPFFRDRLRSGFFRYLADRAYALYLLHPEALAVLKRLSPLPTVVSFALTWALSLAFAELLYRLIERPFMRLRERVPAMRSAETAPLPPAQPSLPQVQPSVQPPLNLPQPGLTPLSH
jgi:peptidoglycan/LPS O-acetylase OafA/YrhL